MEHVFEAKATSQKIIGQELATVITSKAQSLIRKIEKLWSTQVDYAKVNNQIQETRMKYERYRIHF